MPTSRIVCLALASIYTACFPIDERCLLFRCSCPLLLPQDFPFLSLLQHHRVQQNHVLHSHHIRLSPSTPLLSSETQIVALQGLMLIPVSMAPRSYIVRYQSTVPTTNGARSNSLTQHDG
ncbi:hypothetical protein LZ30DRAFT_695705 [Colletotrichum cereale]|nr:hypothetical protein LZ30DRAFT_695705 [Colletotrichum cereale]